MPIKQSLEPVVSSTDQKLSELFVKVHQQLLTCSTQEIQAVSTHLQGYFSVSNISELMKHQSFSAEQKINALYKISQKLVKGSLAEISDPLDSGYQVAETKTYRFSPEVQALPQAEKLVPLSKVKTLIDHALQAFSSTLTQQLTGQQNACNSTLQAKLNTFVKEMEQRFTVKQEITIRTPQSNVKFPERAHKQMAELVRLLTARNHEGWSEFVYCWGAPGAGKTRLTRQIAKAIGMLYGADVPYYVFPGGPTVTEGKMLGYNNVATGTFVQGWLYKPYKEGGVVAIDEGDLCDAAAFAGANSIENDEFWFGNGELVKRHPNFFLIVWANTMGTGSTGGFAGTNKLNAATLDRLTTYKLEYDEDLEKEIFQNKAWAMYVQKVRKYVKEQMNESVYITPRATRKGAAMLAAGFTPERTCELTLFARCALNVRQTIESNVGKFSPVS